MTQGLQTPTYSCSLLWSLIPSYFIVIGTTYEKVQVQRIELRIEVNI